MAKQFPCCHCGKLTEVRWLCTMPECHNQPLCRGCAMEAGIFGTEKAVQFMRWKGRALKGDDARSDGKRSR